MGRGSGAGGGGPANQRGARTDRGPRLGTRFESVGSLEGVTGPFGEELTAGAGFSRTRLETQKKLLARGQQPGPVQISVSPSGKMSVIDGRHRIAAAREMGLETKLKVRFLRGREN